MNRFLRRRRFEVDFRVADNAARKDQPRTKSKRPRNRMIELDSARRLVAISSSVRRLDHRDIPKTAQVAMICNAGLTR